ncbi:hypothetical protein MKW92_052404 [Papaver armeniacum]|nr:hypothetical protein MKW92_052404 [Papaver armeniacum]
MVGCQDILGEMGWLRRNWEYLVESAGLYSDSSGSCAADSNIGSGSRSTFSGMGLKTQVAMIVNGDHHAKLSGDSQIVNGGNDLSSYSSSDVTSTRASGNVYMPQSGTLGGASVYKAMVLKGEDFQALQATLSSAPDVGQKQHNVLQRRQEQRVTGVAFHQQKDSSHSGTSIHVRPQIQSSHLSCSSDDSRVGKLDSYIPDPLPLAPLKHTCNWADVPNLFEGGGILDGEGEKVLMRKFARGSTYSRDVKTSSGRGGGYNARDQYCSIIPTVTEVISSPKA